MKALRHEGAGFMAFLFETPELSSHEGLPYLPRREKKLFGGYMENTICKNAATIQFWDIYAKWYKLCGLNITITMTGLLRSSPQW